MLALEIMAQAAARLSSAAGVAIFEDVDFRTGQVRATPRFTAAWPPASRRWRPAGDPTRVPLDPATDLYGQIVAAGRSGQRILGYRKLTARSCVAEISTDAGEPGIRQAFLDAIAGCVPDARLVPVAVDRFCPAAALGPEGPLVLYAAERHWHDRTHTFDLDVHARCGRLIERWQGLRLVAGRGRAAGRGWPRCSARTWSVGWRAAGPGARWSPMRAARMRAAGSSRRRCAGCWDGRR